MATPSPLSTSVTTKHRRCVTVALMRNRHPCPETSQVAPFGLDGFELDDDRTATVVLRNDAKPTDRIVCSGATSRSPVAFPVALRVALDLRALDLCGAAARVAVAAKQRHDEGQRLTLPRGAR